MVLLLFGGCAPRGEYGSALESPSDWEPPWEESHATLPHVSPADSAAQTQSEPSRSEPAPPPADSAEQSLPESPPPEQSAEPSSQPEETPPVAAEEVFAVSELSQEMAAYITGNSWKEDGPIALEDLRHVTVTHLDFTGAACRGELIVHAQLAQEVADIFRELYAAGFPVAQVGLIELYGCDDAASMAAGNSSCLNTRKIAGTDRWSNHSWAAAVDINPVQNPYVTAAAALPTQEYLDRSDLRPGMIVEGDACYNAFTSRGWIWGGHWPNPDYQHFEKALAQ